MKKNKDRFKRIKGNNKIYKSIKTTIDPFTNGRVIKVGHVKPIDNDILHKGIDKKIRGK